ncbi:hypothetical protein MTR62_18620 [Novosphingobium sp. 1949]|uniref:Uncharacterized protein n=1 Tax=Novosphingobium organovorum TaxID=2930092 RepID=A0ABT0BI00_9SPHN|nr:hypothetical protein [Novosphingobium organovorum]MCJ2184686.1 hypothetical protein [Novosphingobium organovorum]
MTCHFPSPRFDTSVNSALLVEAARCWRQARDGGHPGQPGLFPVLSAHDCEMLVPVFDSLMGLCEDALGRPVAVGEGAWLSDDERMLIGLIDGSMPRGACIACAQGAGSALDCAICSVRIMMGLPVPHTLGERPPRP